MRPSSCQRLPERGGRGGGNRGDSSALDVLLAKPWPNLAVEPTPNSLRSCVASAIGRGSPRALL